MQESNPIILSDCPRAKRMQHSCCHMPQMRCYLLSCTTHNAKVVQQKLVEPLYFLSSKGFAPALRTVLHNHIIHGKQIVQRGVLLTLRIFLLSELVSFRIRKLPKIICRLTRSGASFELNKSNITSLVGYPLHISMEPFPNFR